MRRPGIERGLPARSIAAFTGVGVLSIGLACLAVTATAVHAADADPVVKAQLEKKGTPFTIDDDGDFQITVRIDDDRTQLVWVRSAVEETTHMRVREIWSPGYQSEGAAFPATGTRSFSDFAEEGTA